MMHNIESSCFALALQIPEEFHAKFLLVHPHDFTVAENSRQLSAFAVQRQLDLHTLSQARVSAHAAAALAEVHQRAVAGDDRLLAERLIKDIVLKHGFWGFAWMFSVVHDVAPPLRFHALSFTALIDVTMLPMARRVGNTEIACMK